jgi:hypothetical protein
MVTRYVTGVRFARPLMLAVFVACGAVLPIACGSSASTNVTGPTAIKCQVTLSNNASELPSSGGTGSLTVNSERECSWSATTSAAWVSLSSTSGQGPANIDYSVQPNPNGTSRQAQVVVASESVNVVQAAAPCKYSVSPATATVDAPGGDVSFAVTATPGCQWTAKGTADWIAGVSPSSGTGNATIRVAVPANTGPAVRAGNIIVGDAQATVQQAGVTTPIPPPPPTPTPEPTPPPPPSPPPPACTVTVAPISASIDAAGGDVHLTVTAAAGCAWSSTSNVSWITISAGAAGSGSGAVVATVAPNPGVARTGTIVVAGRTLTITQAAPAAPACTYQLTPPSLNVTSDAQDSTVAVTAADGCQWEATSSVPWITIADPRSGAGNGTFKLTIAANTADARSGTVLVGSATLAVQQAAGATCSYAINPASYTAGLAADAVDVTVTAGTTCAWTAASGAPWVTVASGASGTGNGLVHLTIDANTGPARSTVVTIAGQAFTVQQAGVCTYAIKPTFYDAGKGPDRITVNVTADPGCAWTASSPVSWATIADGATGTGNGVVTIAVQANDGPARAATLTIASQPFQLTQKGK